MLVEDEDDHHFITKLVLRQAQYTGTFTAFHDPMDALEHLRRTGARPDLMLVDINMPGTNGFEFLGVCEEEGLLPNGSTHVVMCSSSIHPMDIETARHTSTVHDYIEKSFSLEQYHRLAEAIQLKAQPQRGSTPPLP